MNGFVPLLPFSFFPFVRFFFTQSVILLLILFVATFETNAKEESDQEVIGAGILYLTDGSSLACREIRVERGEKVADKTTENINVNNRPGFLYSGTLTLADLIRTKHDTNGEQTTQVLDREPLPVSALRFAPGTELSDWQKLLTSNSPTDRLVIRTGTEAEAILETFSGTLQFIENDKIHFTPDEGETLALSTKKIYGLILRSEENHHPTAAGTVPDMIPGNESVATVAPTTWRLALSDETTLISLQEPNREGEHVSVQTVWGGAFQIARTQILRYDSLVHTTAGKETSGRPSLIPTIEIIPNEGVELPPGLNESGRAVLRDLQSHDEHDF